MILELTDPAAAAEVLDHLRDCGPPAATHLNRAISACESEITTALATYHPGTQFSPKLAETLPGLAAAIHKKRVYQGRLAHLGNGRARKAEKQPTEAEELHRRLLDHAGDRYISDLRALTGGAEAQLRSRIEALTAQIATYKGIIGGTGFTDGHDGAYSLLAQAVQERRKLEARLAGLTQNQTQRRQVQGEAVRAAIVGAGGPQAVATGLREASVVAGRWLEEDASWPALRAAMSDQADAVARLHKLGLDAQSALPADATPLVRHTLERLAAAAEQAGRLAEELESRRQAAVLSLVKRAEAGDEEARAQIQATAEQHPEAFTPGFASSLASAQFERQSLGALIHECLDLHTSTPDRERKNHR